MFKSSSILLLGAMVVATAQIDLTPADRQQADQITQFVSTAEWLGPMGAIALSPFFGITCLAGIAQFGEGTWLEHNHFISTNPVLKHPALFWTFLGLTILTSLPRLTKISKPIAQALDQVETYAGIITLIVIRVVSAVEQQGMDAEAVAVVQMGMFTLTYDVILMIAAVINIFVINTVRFFFEVLVWVTPIPAIDALFEAANKGVCAFLLAVYAFSPLAALTLNAVIFLACAVVFRWIWRRVDYARHVLSAFVWSTIGRRRYPVPEKEFVVFADGVIGPFPSRSRLLLRRTERGWSLVKPGWLRGERTWPLNDAKSATIFPGLFAHRLEFQCSPPIRVIFSFRYSSDLDELAKRFRFELEGNDVTEKGAAPAVPLG